MTGLGGKTFIDIVRVSCPIQTTHIAHMKSKSNDFYMIPHMSVYNSYIMQSFGQKIASMRYHARMGPTLLPNLVMSHKP